MLTKRPAEIAPLLCCIVAVLAMIAAGVLLYDSRDVLSGVDDSGDDFVSYQPAESVPPDDDQVAPVDDEGNVAWEDAADKEQWEVLEPRRVDESPDERDTPETFGDADPTAQPSPAGTSNYQGPTGRIVVVTNFTRASVVINDEPYPTYSDDGQNRGMELPANQPHKVLVEFDGEEQLYEITLRPGERRMLMVELTGLGEGRAAPSKPTPQPRERRTSQEEDDEDIADGEGRITVYSRPRGEIFVGEESTGEQTPGTVDVEPGRHEVQVEYRGGDMSETKTVRVREGSRVKLFFRDSD